jgi:NAD(P)H-flavin reductase
MSAASVVDPFVPRSCRVAAAVREDADTVTLDLVPMGGGTVSFQPGQFNMLYAFGVGEAAISMSGDPADESRFVHTVRSVGAVSAALSQAAVGEVIGVRGPFGAAWPMDEAEGKDVVVVAGGLGLAPLRPAIYRLLAQREKFGRVVILIGMRNPSGILYRHEIEEWRRRLDTEIEVTVDHADQAWRGNVGVVPALIPRMAFDPNNTVAMLCGPEIMMRFTVGALREVQVPLEERAPLPAGQHYVSDLAGCEVWERRGSGAPVERLGSVRDVEFPGGGTPLLVVDGPSGEILIPLAEDICVLIDPASRRIEVALPEGLRELNR